MFYSDLLQPEIVNVKIPRFILQDNIELLPVIKNLGARDVTTPGQADFGNLVMRNLIHLSSFRHKYDSPSRLSRLCSHSVKCLQGSAGSEGGQQAGLQ